MLNNIEAIRSPELSPTKIIITYTDQDGKIRVLDEQKSLDRSRELMNLYDLGITFPPLKTS